MSDTPPLDGWRLPSPVPSVEEEDDAPASSSESLVPLHLRAILRAVAHEIIIINANLDQVAHIIRSNPQQTGKALDMLRRIQHTVEHMIGLMAMINEICDMIEKHDDDDDDDDDDVCHSPSSDISHMN